MNSGVLTLFVVMLGVAEGMLVGTAWIALLSLLDVVPRLVSLTRSARWFRVYEGAIVAGGITAGIADSIAFRLTLPPVIPAVVGLLMGFFVGLFTAALAEVLNVLPIISRRFGMKEFTGWLVVALTLGKTIGALLQFLLF
ncbi:MAG: stage V sporulation protein AB [Bacillota bacterium]